MRRCALIAVAITSATLSLLSAQSAEPMKVAVGGELTITQPCDASKPPMLILNKVEVPPSDKSANPKWLFVIPSNVAPNTYAATFRCPTDPVTNAPVGQIVVAAAKTQAGTQTPPASPAGNQPPPIPRVTGVVNLTTNAPGPVPVVVLKNVLRLSIEHLDAWQRAHPTTKLHLFIAGAQLKNVVGAPTSSAEPELLALRLSPEVDEKDEQTRKNWVQVLKAAKHSDVEISVGPEGQAPFPSTAKIKLDVYPTYRTYGTLAIYAVLAYFIVRLGRTSWMLRDSNGAANPPYSLARTQMAIWTIVVVGAYLYIWVTTGLFSWVSMTALALIGISGATGLVAVSMDNSKRVDANAARDTLKAERDALDRTLNDSTTGLQTQLRAAAPGSPQAAELSAAVASRLARFNELTALLNQSVPVPHNSDGWIKDLVSDEKGVSFHRVQLVVWTVVLVMIFIYAVRDNVLMPEFDNTLLGLMGISSGTYLGFKFPERPA